jgi:hypothetical protein
MKKIIAIVLASFALNAHAVTPEQQMERDANCDMMAGFGEVAAQMKAKGGKYTDYAEVVDATLRQEPAGKRYSMGIHRIGSWVFSRNQPMTDVEVKRNTRISCQLMPEWYGVK